MGNTWSHKNNIKQSSLKQWYCIYNAQISFIFMTGFSCEYKHLKGSVTFGERKIDSAVNRHTLIGEAKSVASKVSTVLHISTHFSGLLRAIRSYNWPWWLQPKSNTQLHMTNWMAKIMKLKSWCFCWSTLCKSCCFR